MADKEAMYTFSILCSGRTRLEYEKAKTPSVGTRLYDRQSSTHFNTLDVSCDTLDMT